MKKNKIYTGIFVVVLFVQIIRMIYGFECQKEGQHSDEIWGYGLANSYYNPYIFSTDDPGEKVYENEWIDGKVFSDYIMVEENERF